MPADLRASWSQRTHALFGVFNQAWPDAERDAMTPKIFKTTMRNALQAADDTVWGYAEKTNLLNPQAETQPWLNAIKRTRTNP